MEGKLDGPCYRADHEFCVALPKVELHAHLNGSLSLQTLRELRAVRGEPLELRVEDYVYGGGDWRALGKCFGVAHALTDTPAAVELAARRTVREFRLDGCVYLELRSAPRATGAMSREQYIEALLRGIREDAAPGITATYLVSLDRRWPPDAIAETTELAVRFHRRYPETVVGVDLSGDPGVGDFKDFVPALNKARSAGLKVSVHCAEVPAAAETLAMLSWAPDRVGHAVHVSPAAAGGSRDLWRRLLRSRVPVEVCLTSNVRVGAVPTYAAHHLRGLLRAGHPVALCTDDAGLLGTTLAREYATCAETFRLCRHRVARLALAACRHVFAADGVRQALCDSVREFCEARQLDLGDCSCVEPLLGDKLDVEDAL